jgi:hypothetical protein
MMQDHKSTAAFPSLPDPLEKILDFRRSPTTREIDERSFGDTEIDWQGATPSWGSLFSAIVLPVVGVLAVLAAIAVALYST